MEYELTFIGLLLSLLFTGITGIYPGGIIVPSYLVLFIQQPERIAGTIITAFLTTLCYKLFSRYVILFGRRRFIFMLITAGLWVYIWYTLFPVLLPQSQEFRVIGWVIPGLIANHFERQGILITICSLVTVTVMIFVTGKIISLCIGMF
ncbi:MAG: poly-gamma-glutamate biosynthesis protein PgsC [bacterium]